jgi:hypothetical protein
MITIKINIIIIMIIIVLVILFFAYNFDKKNTICKKCITSDKIDLIKRSMRVIEHDESCKMF